MASILLGCVCLTLFPHVILIQFCFSLFISDKPLTEVNVDLVTILAWPIYIYKKTFLIPTPFVIFHKNTKYELKYEFFATPILHHPSIVIRVYIGYIPSLIMGKHTIDI